MAIRRETIFTKDFIDSVNEDGHWAYKIPDAGAMHGKRPFDVVACVYGKFVAIEFKQYTTIKPFGVRELSEHQTEKLIEVEQAGGIGLVGLFIKGRNGKGDYRLYTWRIFQLVAQERFTTLELTTQAYAQAERVSRVYTNKVGKESRRNVWRFNKVLEIL